MKVNNISTYSELNDNSSELVIIGRNEEEKRVICNFYNHEPYFFITKEDYINNNSFFNDLQSKYKLKIVDTNLKSYKEEKEVVKIITPNHKVVPIVRDIIKELDIKTYEADVLYRFRVTLDRNLSKGVVFEKFVKYFDRYYVDVNDTKPLEDTMPIFKVCSIDLEVDYDTTMPSASNPRFEIFSISLYDHNKNYVIQFATNIDDMDENIIKIKKKIKIYKELNLGEEIDYYIRLYKNERLMLEDFVNYLKLKQFDVITAYNGSNFDFPYLFGRLNLLKIDFSCISPVNRGFFSKKDKKPVIDGVVLFDTLDGYKKLTLGEQTKYSLDYTSKMLFGIGKVGYEEERNLKQLRLHNFDKFLLYNFYDVVLERAIIREKKLIWFFYFVKTITNVDFNDVLWNSRLVDSIFLSNCRELNLVLPTKEYGGENNGDTIEGGYVETPPRSGIFVNVIVIDLSQSYPSAGATLKALGTKLLIFSVRGTRFNPRDKDFKIKANKYIEETTGKKFNFDKLIGPIYIKKFNKLVYLDKSKIGLISYVFEKYMKIRNKLKRKYLETTDEIDYIIQEVFKFIVNSIYGVLLNPGFRMYNKIDASLITTVAREPIYMAREVLEKLGFKIIYGDTDSIHFLSTYDNIDDILKQANDVIEIINKYIDRKFKTIYNIEKCYFKFSLEEIYKKIFFKQKKGEKGAAKKNYAGRVVIMKGVKKEKIVIKGFKRSDVSECATDTRDKLFELILGDNNNIEEIKEQVIKYLRKVVRKIRNTVDLSKPEKERFTLSYICQAKGIGRDIEDYANQNSEIPRAVRWFNENHNKLGSNIVYGKGDKPKFVYFIPSKIPSKYTISDIGCLDEYDNLPEDLYSAIDIEKIIDKFFVLKVESITQILNIDKSEYTRVKNIKVNTLYQYTDKINSNKREVYNNVEEIEKNIKKLKEELNC